jgi:hypothetical protein
MDRESLTLPVANSQFYTAAVSSIANMLIPVAQTPIEKDVKDAINNNVNISGTNSSSSNPQTPVFELTEEVREKCKQHFK